MKKVMFIGQAPPLKIVDLPFGKSALYKWLESIGISYEKKLDFELKHNQEGILYSDGKPAAEVKFGALINYFPGLNKANGHLAPTKEQIINDAPILSSIIKNFNPDIIIPIGKLSIGECLGNENIKLEESVGKQFIVDPYNALGQEISVIPFPHPSGASTWIYQKDNPQLLKKALELLKQQIKL